MEGCVYVGGMVPVSEVEGCLVNISWQPSTKLSGTNLPTQLWHPSKHQELIGTIKSGVNGVEGGFELQDHHHPLEHH